MARIIVNYDENKINDLHALYLVESVIMQGKISNDNTQYCYCTLFDNNVVFADVTKTVTNTFKVVQKDE